MTEDSTSLARKQNRCNNAMHRDYSTTASAYSVQSLKHSKGLLLTVSDSQMLLLLLYSRYECNLCDDAVRVYFICGPSARAARGTIHPKFKERIRSFCTCWAFYPHYFNFEMVTLSATRLQFRCSRRTVAQT